VPTVSESGVPGFEAKSWFGLVAEGGQGRQRREYKAHQVASPATLTISRALCR
jgi:tripartite-type tricarboxylate transporter receptor subunit TctC